MHCFMSPSLLLSCTCPVQPLVACLQPLVACVQPLVAWLTLSGQVKNTTMHEHQVYHMLASKLLLCCMKCFKSQHA